MSKLCYISVKCVNKYAIRVLVCAAWHQREQENKLLG